MMMVFKQSCVQTKYQFESYRFDKQLRFLVYTQSYKDEKYVTNNAEK